MSCKTWFYLYSWILVCFLWILLQSLKFLGRNFGCSLFGFGLKAVLKYAFWIKICTWTCGDISLECGLLEHSEEFFLHLWAWFRFFCLGCESPKKPGLFHFQWPWHSVVTRLESSMWSKIEDLPRGKIWQTKKSTERWRADLCWREVGGVAKCAQTSFK